VRVVVGEPVRLPEPGLSLDRYVLQTA
jgi:hypothetical protein